MRWGSFSTTLHKHCQWGICPKSYKPHIFPTHLVGLPSSTEKTHGISLFPRSHSKNDHIIIHFRQFLLELMHHWKCLCTKRRMTHELRFCRRAFRISARLPSVLLLTQGDFLLYNYGIGLHRDAFSFLFPSIWCLLSIHQSYGRNCTDMVPHMALKSLLLCSTSCFPSCLHLQKCLGGDIDSWIAMSLTHTQLPTLLNPKNLLSGDFMINGFIYKSLEKFSIMILTHFVIWKQQDGFIGSAPELLFLLKIILLWDPFNRN